MKKSSYLCSEKYNGKQLKIMIISKKYIKVLVVLTGVMTLVACEKYEFTGGGFRLDGASNALFSVAEGKQVRFSKGNLLYRTTDRKWYFAENQYDTVGGANSDHYSTEYLDLFGWGTSSWNSTAVCYEPWSTSQGIRDYLPGGSSTADLTGAYAEADWAWHNAIENGGEMPHMWRTMTVAEWKYLLSGREEASEKCGVATVNGVAGLVILPDFWEQPGGTSFIPGFNGVDANDFSRNTNYTRDQWARMEAGGAVFLPAAGYRYGSNVEDVGRFGGYWSVSVSSNENFACHMGFRSYGLGPDMQSHRYYGYAVRPVMDK